MKMDSQSNSEDFDNYFLNNGQITIIGDINEELYLQVSKQLRWLRKLDVSRVRIYINSQGGEVESALAIIDEFKLFQQKGSHKEVWTIATGNCCSAAAFILAYGSKRFATDNATIMVHPISYDPGEGEHQSTKTYVEYAERLYKNVMWPLAARCGRKSTKEVEKFIEEIRNGKWMEPEEAKEFGIIDDIWDYSLENF